VDLDYTADPTTADLFHVNSVDYNPALDQIALSVRNFSEVWILDHSTTTQEAKGDRGSRSGKGGGLIYRWGNPEAWGSGAGTQQLLWQHDAHWIAPGLPGEGRFLVFNNLDPGGGRFSSVVEFEPPLNPDGSHARLPGGGFGPEQPYWAYTAPEPEEFFSAFISGSQRLPNGNTLICSGGQGLIFEVTPEGDTVWKYLVGRNMSDRVRNVFRACWYPADYAGLRGSPLGPAAALALRGARAR
jgi:hypothetical protein